MSLLEKIVDDVKAEDKQLLAYLDLAKPDEEIITNLIEDKFLSFDNASTDED